MSPGSTPVFPRWCRSSFRAVSPSERRPPFSCISARGQPVGDLRPALPDEIGPRFRLDLAVRNRGALVLPQMLRPTFDNESFDEAARCRCIFEESPTDGSIAAGGP